MLTLRNPFITMGTDPQRRLSQPQLNLRISPPYTPDEERTGCLGDTEISFGISEAKKQISTATEWSAAWRRASKAIEFTFPHQREELLHYGDYIESEFTA